ncbi:AAA family ATPase [Bacillota bacterium LX-D]|nr:AAA family ATPase [Bacillota bacterium LX-D]
MSEINEIKRQFQDGQWKKFLKSIKITNLRGWTGQSISFNFPVCAIVGENGIGKSTFLRAAACAYENRCGLHPLAQRRFYVFFQKKDIL